MEFHLLKSIVKNFVYCSGAEQIKSSFNVCMTDCFFLKAQGLEIFNISCLISIVSEVFLCQSFLILCCPQWTRVTVLTVMT